MKQKIFKQKSKDKQIRENLPIILKALRNYLYSTTANYGLAIFSMFINCIYFRKKVN